MPTPKVRKSAAAPNPTAADNQLNMALNDQRCVLYQVRRIIGLASDHLQGIHPDPEIAWGAIDGALTLLLDGVIDRIESKEVLLIQEVTNV